MTDCVFTLGFLAAGVFSDPCRDDTQNCAYK